MGIFLSIKRKSTLNFYRNYLQFSGEKEGTKAEMSSYNKAEIPYYNKKSLGSYSVAFSSSFASFTAIALELCGIV